MIERIIFLSEHEAEEALMHYKDGAEAAIDYLSQWHYPGEHETSLECSAGSSDRIHKIGRYTLIVNLPLQYIGLEYTTEE